jgi:hypothetical protein
MGGGGIFGKSPLFIVGSVILIKDKTVCGVTKIITEKGETNLGFIGADLNDLTLQSLWKC